MTTTPRNYHITTFGCQMNKADSERMAGILDEMGLTFVEDPNEADIVLYNTCTIRDNAEQKVYSYLGRQAKRKQENPNVILAIAGCVAQQEGDSLMRRVPELDLVMGPQHANRLRDLLEQVLDGSQVVATEPIHIVEDITKPRRDSDVTAWVNVIYGCNERCTYCVVPRVRGVEQSRTPEAIRAEMEELGRQGYKEVTLLGQNVNSYGKKEGLCTFAELLSRINDIKALARIRFTTSHPKDLSDGLISAFGRLDKLCNHLHLPIQSGSNRVLKRMNRKYTREAYLEKVAALREVCPEIAITTDIIVGFPGESAADFDETLTLIQQMRYDSLFVFNYSDRPLAPSRKFVPKVGEKEKNARLQQVLEVQNSITAGIHAKMVGRQMPVLVEGHSKRQQAEPSETSNKNLQWTGRTTCNKIVNFIVDGPAAAIPIDITGETVRVNIERALSHSLWGVLQVGSSGYSELKGDRSYAA